MRVITSCCVVSSVFCVRTCTRVHLCVYVWMCACNASNNLLCARVHVYACVCMYGCVHAMRVIIYCACACACARLCARVCVCVCACVCACVRACVCVCVFALVCAPASVRARLRLCVLTLILHGFLILICLINPNLSTVVLATSSSQASVVYLYLCSCCI